MSWTATIDKSDPTHPIHVHDRYPADDGGSDHLTPTEARALAADLIRAVEAVEPVVDRSCFTCAHDFKASTGRHTCRTSVNIGGYINAAGLDNSPDGMPTDRSIPCPGHAREVTS